ncbi:hypothetical protein LCGC14_0171580 [marine sediment metagenome]|jgi:hypothetical protein|uniref:Uncharacterized protein n=1 Tax=marine sediment metagenome TaxID=412755 RepID=A0A0F9XV49_9ZZZZ|tara:strand:+ start:37212 stop:37790 length:579 start_codon:yes stop_codon:yes gene_type:complete
MSALDDLNLAKLPLPKMAFELSLHAPKIRAATSKPLDDPFARKIVLGAAAVGFLSTSWLVVWGLSSVSFLLAVLATIGAVAAAPVVFRKLSHFIHVTNPERKKVALIEVLQRHLYDDVETRVMGIIVLQAAIDRYTKQPWLKTAQDEWRSGKLNDLQFIAEVLAFDSSLWGPAENYVFELHQKRAQKLIQTA